MNRQEIIEQLKLIQAGLTQDDNNKSKNRIDAVIESLKQPITLADFLGWEENVEYAVYNDYFKIVNNRLYIFNAKTGEYEISLRSLNFEEFTKKNEIQTKKFLLVLKEGYVKLFNLQDKEKFLTMNTQTKEVYHSKNDYDIGENKVLFTGSEMKEIRYRYNIDLSIYNIFRRDYVK